MATASSAPVRDPFLQMLDSEDPTPLLHQLRIEDPVHFVEPFGFWLVTRHDDVKRLFNDPQNCQMDRTHWEHHRPAPEGSLVRWLQDENPINKSPEAHARFRRLFNRALTPRA